MRRNSTATRAVFAALGVTVAVLADRPARADVDTFGLEIQGGLVPATVGDTDAGGVEAGHADLGATSDAGRRTDRGPVLIDREVLDDGELEGGGFACSSSSTGRGAGVSLAIASTLLIAALRRRRAQ